MNNYTDNEENDDSWGGEGKFYPMTAGKLIEKLLKIKDKNQNVLFES